ncbi:hypothetical protein B425_1299 [Bacillus amyloliquefaciens]|nr:hypothetical protein LL3_01291 [Bacillus amyloliquefaciens LL3]KYC97996.1 hypothetical protein B425_1299 [Bacillus amyloliquefaciens]
MQLKSQYFVFSTLAEVLLKTEYLNSFVPPIHLFKITILI